MRTGRALAHGTHRADTWAEARYFPPQPLSSPAFSENEIGAMAPVSLGLGRGTWNVRSGAVSKLNGTCGGVAEWSVENAAVGTGSRWPHSQPFFLLGHALHVLCEAAQILRSPE